MSHVEVSYPHTHVSGVETNMSVNILRRWISTILPLALVLGCSSSSEDKVCIAHETLACTCVDGGSGFQECNSGGDGFKTGCQCSGAQGDASGTDAQSDGTEQAGQGDTEQQGDSGEENRWATADDGSPCDDLDLCTTNDTVFEGVCAGEPKNCDDENPCTNDDCDPSIGFCENVVAALPCDDGDPCTTDDICLEDSSCVGAPLCGTASVCHEGECLDYPTNATVCGEQECGPGDFGAMCGDCDDEKICNSDGKCVSECTVDCEGKMCGPDGCGGFCGTWATGDEACSGLPCGDDGLCVTLEDCVPNCDSDLCGGSSSCAPKSCGSDGCGGSCGICPDDQLCASDSFCDTSCLDLSLCPSLGFETQTLIDWTYTGSAYVVPNLGESKPPEGKAMLHLSTKKNNNGYASKKVLIPEDATGFEVSWRFYSEEFLAWCNSQFQDDFTISLTVGDQPLTVVAHTIKEICPKDQCDDCSGLFPLEPSDIDFDQGEAYRTPWIRSTVSFAETDFPGSIALIEIKISDVGDGIFESHLLVDDLGFVQEASVETASLPVED